MRSPSLCVFFFFFLMQRRPCVVLITISLVPVCAALNELYMYSCCCPVFL